MLRGKFATRFVRCGRSHRFGSGTSGGSGSGDWARYGGQRGTAMIFGRELRAISGGFAHVLHLRRERRGARFTADGEFRCGGLARDATISAVITDARVGVVHDRVRVDVANNSYVDVACLTVIEERIAVPIAAIVAHAGVAEAIVNAAIEAD